MPLNHGYGLVAGSKQNYYRDPVDNFGRYYHGNLIVRAGGNDYRCAIDVDPAGMPDGIQWRVVTIRAQDFAPLKALADGWHALTPDPASGALDYIRDPVLHPPVLIWNVRYSSCLAWLLRFLRWNPPWNSGTGIQALTALEAVIDQAARCYVFGEPFTTGFGVHNIHQNQGDPVNSPFAAENGIWQDGATIIEKTDGSVVGFLNKFKTQSFKTDDLGRPI
jgi:hypothetical protein